MYLYLSGSEFGLLGLVSFAYLSKFIQQSFRNPEGSQRYPGEKLINFCDAKKLNTAPLNTSLIVLLFYDALFERGRTRKWLCFSA